MQKIQYDMQKQTEHEEEENGNEKNSTQYIAVTL